MNETNKQIAIFTCDICDKDKQCRLHLAKVNGLGIDPHKLQKICKDCIKWVDIIDEKPKEYEF